MGRLWSSIVTALSIVCTFVFLLGCISPPTKDLAFYRVNVTLLADGLVNLSTNNTRGLADLRHPDLPTYWYWGSSGICDVTPKSATRCRHSFPATQNIVKVVEESLRDNLGSDQEDVIRDVVTSWDVTVTSIPSALLVDKQATYAAKSKASVALAILSLVVSFAILILFLIFGNDDGHGVVLLISFGNAMIVMAAGVLATLSMNDGVHGVVDTGEHGGAGIILLFVGGALSILWAVGSYFCGTSKEPDNPGRMGQGFGKPNTVGNGHELSSTEGWNSGNGGYRKPSPIQNGHEVSSTQGWNSGNAGYRRRDEEDVEHFKRLSKHGIGFLGENQVYKWLRSNIYDFSPDHWTSGLRERASLPEFGENEKDYSDFEYHDRIGLMRRALFDAGARGLPERPGIKYHLEVKTTLGDLTTPFFISRFQRELIDDYHGDSNHAYIIIRIFRANNSRGPQQVFLIDPFILLRDGTLEEVREENGGLWVKVASESYYPRLAARL